MRASRLFLHVAVVLWGVGLVYGCAVGADEGDGDGADDCVVGSEGCACTPGGACDPGLQCLSDFCVDATGAGGNTGQGGTASAGGAPSSNTSNTSSTNSTSSGPATTTGSGPSTTATTGTTTTTGGSCALAEPTMVTWCATGCDVCESWPVSWSPVQGATHYKIRWRCSILPEEISNNIYGTSVDFANGPEVDAGNLGCGYSVHSVYVMACDATCCTSGALVPTSTYPPVCGGGCCA